jgi:lambda family phage portal protein
MEKTMQIPKQTLLDKAISWVAPNASLKRWQARTHLAMLGGYTGARRDRRQTKTWNTAGGSADAVSLDDLPTLRDRSRDLLRNAPLATGAVNTLITNVVGTGLRPQSHIDRAVLRSYLKTDDAMEKWEAEAERIFTLWAGSLDCDITRGQTFTDLQALLLRSCLESGDVFVLRKYRERKGNPFGTALQVVEADRIASPVGNNDKIVAGVEIDDDGAPTAYHILNHHPDDHDGGKLESAKVPAFDADGRWQVLHIFTRMRPGLTRGIPYLASVIESLKQLDRYIEAEIMAAVISSMFTIFVKSEGEEGLNPLAGEKPSKSGDYKLSPGAILDLQPNENIEIANPNRPNQAFDGFVQSILRQIGVALEIPFEVLIKHFTSSYSAAQAALVEAWKTFSTRRKWISVQFCQPVYEMVVAEAVAKDFLEAPGFFADPFVRAAYLGAEWIGPPRGQIDQLKEIRAVDYRVRLGVSTLEEETAQITGGSWETKHTQRAREHKMRTEAGLVEKIDNEKEGKDDE